MDMSLRAILAFQFYRAYWNVANRATPDAPVLWKDIPPEEQKRWLAVADDALGCLAIDWTKTNLNPNIDVVGE